MDDTAFYFGLVLLVSAICGGGLEALGYKIPVINSVKRQVALAALGVTMTLAGRWDLIYPLINPLHISTVTHGPIALETGEARTIPVVLGHAGEVEVSLRDLHPDWGSFMGKHGQPGQDGLFIRVCSAMQERPCDGLQIQVNQVYRQKLPQGAANISVFNFSTNPRMTTTLDVVYPSRRRFDYR